MKRKIIRAPNQTHKVLEEQSGKLKEKLESLKQQIQQKKKEKQMSKQRQQLTDSRTGSRSSLSRSNLAKSKSNASLHPETSDFGKFLATLQLDHLTMKLQEKSINSLEQFKSIQPDTVDQWKDIPVGYRIKLKNQLKSAKSSLSPSPSKKLSAEKVMQIEEIMEVRKKDKVFEPLSGQAEEEEGDVNRQQLTENEQESMIQSLMDAFNCSDQIEEIQLSPSKKTRVVIQPREAWGHREDFPDYRYCWTCLRKLQDDAIKTYQTRSFCGQGCLQGYKQITKVEQDNKLFQQIEETENKFAQYLQKRKEKAKNERPNKRVEVSNEQFVDIDFQIL